METVTAESPTSKDHLRTLAESGFGNLVKAVVDIEQEIMVIGGEMHADEEELMIENGSKQQNLWGINFYPDIEGEDWIEFDSMINMRPTQGNRTRSVEDPAIQQRIRNVVSKLVQ